MDNILNVEWVKIYNTDYKVSSRGIIVSGDGRTIRQFDDGAGKMLVKLKVNKLFRLFHVDELVANAFVDNPKGYASVEHIDGIDTNNHADNLRWVLKWAKIAARKASKKATNKLRIVQYNIIGEKLAEFDSIYEASMATGINKGSIYKTIEGINKTANGYIFKKEEQ